MSRRRVVDVESELLEALSPLSVSGDASRAFTSAEQHAVGPPLIRSSSLDGSTDERAILTREDDLSGEESDASEASAATWKPPSTRSRASSSASQRSAVRQTRPSALTVQIVLRVDDSETCFASTVSIPSYHEVGKAFVSYRIIIGTTSRATLSFLRRYSQFVVLRAQLRQEYPELAAAIPRLPSKSPARIGTPKFLQRRRAMLELFLASVCLHPVLGSSSTVKRWCLDDLS